MKKILFGLLGLLVTISGWSAETNSGPISSVTVAGLVAQNGTPTPTTPIDIVSNNGVVKVRHQSGLPLGYTLLEYIDTDGNSWIDTGITPTATTLQFDYKMQILQQEYVSLFGAVAATSPRYGFRVYYQPAGGGTNILNWQSGSFGGQQVITWNDILQGTVIATQGVSVVSTINGTTQTYSSSSIDLTQSDTIFLGTSHLGTTSGRGPTRTWSFKITKDGTLVRDFVPAKRNSDNVVGMYDLVSGQFFTNAGTGTFTAGNPVSAPVKIYTDGEVETIGDSANHTATVATLLGVGDYKDEQNINTGAITRNVGVKVLDGTEDGWVRATTSIYNNGLFDDAIGYSADNPAIICSHFQGFPPSQAAATLPNLSAKLGASNQPRRIYFIYDAITTTEQWKQYLAEQYANGTPVIVVYPLATPTTESVTGQTMTTAPVNNRTGGVTGMTITTLLSSGASVVTTIANNAIKIATTAYNSARFSPVVNDLNDTIATIRSVVTNTINQTKAIADLQATKQTRPDENCPAGKKCLLVEDNDGTPHWYEIIESAD